MKKLLAVLLVAAMAFSLCGCDSADYKKAVEAMEGGDYAAASAAFKALGDYEDSAAKALECDYQLALDVFESADYTAAVAVFEALDGYAESADYIAKAKDEIMRAAVVGEWVCPEVDMTEDFMTALEASLGEDVGILDYCELPSLVVEQSMEIQEKGVFTATIDPDSFMEGMTAVLDAIELGLKDYFLTELEAVLAEDGFTLEDAYAELGVSNEDELLTAVLGVSFDELFEAMGLVDALSSSMENAKLSGVWEVEGESLTLTIGDDYEIASYDAAADVLTVTEGTTSSGGYPMAYERK